MPGGLGAIEAILAAELPVVSMQTGPRPRQCCCTGWRLADGRR
jgi:hypothetical protein